MQTKKADTGKGMHTKKLFVLPFQLPPLQLRNWLQNTGLVGKMPIQMQHVDPHSMPDRQSDRIGTVTAKMLRARIRMDEKTRRQLVTQTPVTILPGIA